MDNIFRKVRTRSVLLIDGIIDTLLSVACWIVALQASS